jgi:hypothetical protein
LPLPLPSSPTAKTVISTEAAHSLTVSSAVEKSALLPKQHHPPMLFAFGPFAPRMCLTKWPAKAHDLIAQMPNHPMHLLLPLPPS